MLKNTYFPTTIVDGFFDNPDEIRSLALRQQYTKDIQDRWPGTRTEDLALVSPVVFHTICNKILSLFYTANQPYSYVAQANFQIVGKEYKSGWIHKDAFVITAIVYLTPESFSGGTSLYIKKQIDFNDNDYLQDKFANYKKGFDQGSSRDLHNQNYLETLNVNGLYNRLLVFDSNIYHAAQDFFGNNKEESRLTLVIFFSSIVGDLETPLNRSKNLNSNTTL
jgi:hypothetical protein